MKLISTALVLAAAVLLPRAAEAQPAPAPVPVTIVIYEGGPTFKPDVPPQAQLGAHFGYVAQQFQAGKVVAYGPQTDVLRGYYVLPGSDTAATAAFTSHDPGVTAGLLKLQSTHTAGLIIHSFTASTAGEHYAILRMQPGPKWVKGKPLTEQNVGAHFAYMIEQAKQGLVIGAGPDQSGQEGWYFVKGDKAAVKTLLAHDPGVMSGLLKPVVAGWNVLAMQPLGS